MRSYIAVLSVLVALVGATHPSYAEPPAADAPLTGEVKGIVLDADGGPVQDVVVEAEAVQLDDDDSFPPPPESILAERVLAEVAAPRRVLARAVSGSDGAFQLAGLPLGHTVRLTALPAPPLVPTALLTRPKVTPARSVALRLVHGRPLRVRVVDARGEGIAARVAVTPWPDWMARSRGGTGDIGNSTAIGPGSGARGLMEHDDSQCMTTPDALWEVSSGVSSRAVRL